MLPPVSLDPFKCPRRNGGGAAIAKWPSISISGVIGRRPSTPPHHRHRHGPSPIVSVCQCMQASRIKEKKNVSSCQPRRVILRKESLLYPPSVPLINIILWWAEIRRRLRHRRHQTHFSLALATATASATPPCPCSAERRGSGREGTQGGGAFPWICPFGAKMSM